LSRNHSAPEGRDAALYERPHKVSPPASGPLPRSHARSVAPVRTAAALVSLLILCLLMPRRGSADPSHSPTFTDAAKVPPAQLVVAFPAAGDVVDEPVAVRAEPIPLEHSFSVVSFWLQPWQGSDQAPAPGAWGPGTLSAEAGGLLGPLSSLGVDRDGQDGWHVPLDPAHWPAGLYRVLAIGTDANDRTAFGVGGWFRIQPPGQPWLQLRAPSPPVLRGTLALWGLLGDTDCVWHSVDLSLRPAGEEFWVAGADGSDIQAPYYAGEHSLNGGDPYPPQWGEIRLDSRRASDGSYRAVISLPGEHTVSADAPVRVDNVLSPDLEILYPLPGQVLERVITAEVRVEDLGSTVDRVAFFLQEVPADEADATTVHRSIWLGTDVDGGDGWRVRRAVDPTLDGDAWMLKAVATDSSGLSYTVRSGGTFAIVGRPRPFVRFATPSGNVPLRGLRRVTVHAPAGHQYVDHVQLWARSDDGSLHPLGDMALERTRWEFEWHTTELPDGVYRLLAVATDTEGRTASAWSQPFEIVNRSAGLRFDFATDRPELSGTVPIPLRELAGGEGLELVRLFHMSSAGDLIPIGEDRDARDGWAIPWDTSMVPDGEYTLVAIGTGVDGSRPRAQHRVTVHNRTPHISLAPIESDRDVHGQIEIEWTVDHPLGEDVVVSIAYSPDGGQHWLEVARDLASDVPYLWDTRTVPDSDTGMIRVVADDGTYRTAAISSPFRVNNVNHPPTVSFIAPDPQHLQDRDVHIVWQAWDPDGDDLAVRLEYRRGNGAWMLLIEGEPEPPSYRWALGDLPVDEEYSLRITATDPAGAAGVDTLEGLRLVANHRPTVDLLAPQGNVRLRDQAVVLWTASDADGDELRIDLYYSDDGGLNWLPLAQDLSNTGYYVWQFSFLPSGTDYRLRIVARDGLSAAMDESDSPLIIGDDVTPELAIHTPAEEELLAGWRLVSWRTSAVPGEGHRIRLEARPDGGEWLPLAAETPDDGFWLWDTSALPDGPYLLRISALSDHGELLAVTTRSVTLANGEDRSPTVALYSPRSGDVWSGLREIRWHAHDPDGDNLTARLEISLDAGATWRELDTVPAAAGHSLWDTTLLPPSSACLLRITVDDGQHHVVARTPGVFHLANQPGLPPHISFIGLNDAGILPWASRVLWTADDPDDDPLEVLLALSEDGGRTWRDLARSSTGAAGCTLPALQCGRDNRLRLSATDGVYLVEMTVRVGGSDSCPESIPQLFVDAPAAGDRLAGLHEVRWRVVHPAQLAVSIDLELSRDGGHTWQAVTRAYPNTGVYDLDTRAWPNGYYRLRVTARSMGGVMVRESEAFRIDNVGNNAPVVSLISPAGGETWADIKEVSWHIYDRDGGEHVSSVSYSVDGGVSWQEIARDLRGERSVLWDTANAPNASHVLVRVGVSDGRHVALDVLDRPISIRNPDSPTLTLHVPDGPIWTGIQRLSWTADGGLSGPLQVQLELSIDEGRSWVTLAEGLPARGTYLWDSAMVGDGTHVLVRARASTEGRSAALEAMRTPVTVWGNGQLLAATNPYSGALP